MRIRLLRRGLYNETRVAATPKTVEQLLKLGFSIVVKHDVATLASFDDVRIAWQVHSL